MGTDFSLSNNTMSAFYNADIIVYCIYIYIYIYIIYIPDNLLNVGHSVCF